MLGVERLVLERPWLESLGQQRWALEPERWGLVRWMERRTVRRARHAYVPGEQDRALAALAECTIQGVGSSACSSPTP